MSAQELVSFAMEAGCEVIEYEGHYCVRRTLAVNIVVTVPKVTYLISRLVDKIKAALGL